MQGSFAQHAQIPFGTRPTLPVPIHASAAHHHVHRRQPSYGRVERWSRDGFGAEGDISQGPVQSQSNLRAQSSQSLFELEMEDEACSPQVAAQIPQTLATLLGSSQGLQARLVECALEARKKAVMAGGSGLDADVDLTSFAQHLANAGWAIWIRHGAQPSTNGPGSAGGTPFPRVQYTPPHSFVIAAPPTPGGTLFVVDPCFREQFTIGGTGGSQGGSLAGSTGSGGLGGGRRTDERTEAYAQLLAQLPEVFVGTAEQLSEMVKALCTEMEGVFAARGLPLPPWRSHAAMCARWLVTRAHDTRILPQPEPVALAGAAAAAASAAAAAAAATGIVDLSHAPIAATTAAAAVAAAAAVTNAAAALPYGGSTRGRSMSPDLEPAFI